MSGTKNSGHAAPLSSRDPESIPAQLRPGRRPMRDSPSRGGREQALQINSNVLTSKDIARHQPHLLTEIQSNGSTMRGSWPSIFLSTRLGRLLICSTWRGPWLGLQAHAPAFPLPASSSRPSYHPARGRADHSPEKPHLSPHPSRQSSFLPQWHHRSACPPPVFLE